MLESAKVDPEFPDVRSNNYQLSILKLCSTTGNCTSCGYILKWIVNTYPLALINIHMQRPRQGSDNLHRRLVKRGSMAAHFRLKMFLCASIHDNDWVCMDCQMISIAKCDQMNEQHHISMIFINILCMQTIVLGAQEVYQKWRENKLYVKCYGDIINMCCLLISIVQYACMEVDMI